MLLPVAGAGTRQRIDKPFLKRRFSNAQTTLESCEAAGKLRFEPCGASRG
jgi:hypothetical protein